MAVQNIKKKYTYHVSDPNQNVETKCNSKLKFTYLKDLFIKRVQKIKSKMNYMYHVAKHSNSKYSNFQQDITSDYGFLLRLVNTFTIDTEEYYLMCYKVNDTKTFENLVRSSILTYVYCRLGSLNWGL